MGKSKTVLEVWYAMDKWENPKQSWKFGMPWTKWGK
jgi:hypothetical protein